jgi:hypothetical protein
MRRFDASSLVACHRVPGIMLEMPLLVQNEIRWEEHSGADTQLSYFENAISEQLPSVVPKYPAHDSCLEGSGT